MLTKKKFPAWVLTDDEGHLLRGSDGLTLYARERAEELAMRGGRRSVKVVVTLEPDAHSNPEED